MLALASAAVVGAGCSAPEDTTPEVPATALELCGELRTHDPALVVGQDGEPWYVFSTGDAAVGGGSIQIRTSPDGLVWSEAGTVWDAGTEPAWVRDVVPGVSNFWAPEVHEHDDTYYLYYSASTFGTNTSAIGLLTSPTLDPQDPEYGWVDQGQVIASTSASPYNTIDPAVIEDADGVPYLAFGSFWGGIYMTELSWPSGLPADPAAEPVHLVDRGEPPNAVEAPALMERDGWYYLFVSRDSCCQGVNSTYNMAVGRSREVTGPYVDADGVPLLEGGGTALLATSGDMIGPGGESLSRGYIGFHYYSRSKYGDFRLAIRELGWTGDGWPVVQTAEELAES